MDLSSGGRWTIESDGSGRWELREGAAPEADARVTFSDDAGWRWLTGADVPDGGMSVDGRRDLVEALMPIRGIIA